MAHEIKLPRSIDSSPSPFFVSKNGFVDCVLRAYTDRCELVLTPDDIWLAILFQFQLSQKNMELYRSTLYIPDEVATVKVLDVSKASNQKPTSSFAGALCDSFLPLFKNRKIQRFMIPDFTTTTIHKKMVYASLFFGQAYENQDYFPGVLKLDNMHSYPGKVTLAGTEDDWKQITTRLTQLKDYFKAKEHSRDVFWTKWFPLIVTVVNQLLAMKKTNPAVNPSFWKLFKNTPCDRLGGWLALFCAFDDKGQYNLKVNTMKQVHYIRTYEIPPFINSILMEDKTMVIGHLGCNVVTSGTTSIDGTLPGSGTLIPCVGWYLAYTSETKTPHSTVETKTLHDPDPWNQEWEKEFNSDWSWSRCGSPGGKFHYGCDSPRYSATPGWGATSSWAATPGWGATPRRATPPRFFGREASPRYSGEAWGTTTGTYPRSSSCYTPPRSSSFSATSGWEATPSSGATREGVQMRSFESPVLNDPLDSFEGSPPYEAPEA
jgi:hypothetical protein